MPRQIEVEVFPGSAHSRKAKKTTPWRALHESGAGIAAENLIFQGWIGSCCPFASGIIALPFTIIAGNGITAPGWQIAASSGGIMRDNTPHGNPGFSKGFGKEKHRENSPGIVSPGQQNSHPVELAAINSQNFWKRLRIWAGFADLGEFGTSNLGNGDGPDGVNSWVFNNFSLLELSVHHLLLPREEGPHPLDLLGLEQQEREGTEETRQSSSGITQKSRENLVGAAGKCSITLRAATAPEG